MLKRFQAAIAIALLLLTTVVGQAGIRQCLCTGQIAIGAEAICECTDTPCCHEDTQPAPAPLPSSPCEDDTCWLLISLDDADQPPLLTTTPVPSAVSPPQFTGFVSLTGFTQSKPPVQLQRPPDRRAVPLTVLFSSFLI